MKLNLVILGNDLFWGFSALDAANNYEYVTARWIGYSDAFWWNNVATSEKHQTTTGSNGRKYRINFTTREVTETE